MNMKRLFAVMGIFVLAGAGWMLLGSAMAVRTGGYGARLDQAVRELWGSPILQAAPAFTVEVPGTDRTRTVLPAANRVSVALDLEHRKKGLLWYPTYHCDFDASYEIRNDEAVAQKVRFAFEFPDPEGTYDGVLIEIDGAPLGVPLSVRDGVREIIEVAPGEARTVRVGYRTRGLRQWRYAPSPSGRVRALALDVRTNFRAVDYPAGGLSPTSVRGEGPGLAIAWQADDLLTTQVVGIALPERLNPGPLAGRITFFAPVCLLFYFVLTLLIQVKWRVPIHPMHYLFVAAGFFAFHLLFAYMVDLFNIHVSFLAAAATSMTLVVVYLRAALGKAFPWRIALAAQLVYLVLFSYSFFVKGITGLIITIGSIATLALLMAFTAGVNWAEVFGQPARQPTAVPVVPPLPAPPGKGI